MMGSWQSECYGCEELVKGHSSKDVPRLMVRRVGSGIFRNVFPIIMGSRDCQGH